MFYKRRASNRSPNDEASSSLMSFERDPRDYYNDLPGKIPPPIPPDITKEKNKMVRLIRIRNKVFYFNF